MYETLFCFQLLNLSKYSTNSLSVAIVGVGKFHLQGICQHVQVAAITPLQLKRVVGGLDQLQGGGCWWQGPGGHLVDGTETPRTNTVHGLDAYPALEGRM